MSHISYHSKPQKIVQTAKEWQAVLTPDEFSVMRDEGTEQPFSSPLSDEKRDGMYVCAGCDTPLFSSVAKFDSGTGWPSFFEALPGQVETKTDSKFGITRIEYHCARCGGHQGHVFQDGPAPTGLRYCNNGTSLHFVPETS